MPINFLVIALCACFLSLFSALLFKKISAARKILIPGGVPVIGGVAIGLSFISASALGFFIFRYSSKEAVGIVVASFVMLVFGIIDDWKELSIRAKFLAQIIATAVLIIFGVRTQIVYIGHPANIAITFIWIIGITNAINHLDVIDGLAAGTVIFAALALFAVSIFNADIEAAILSMAVAGAAAGFLFYNFPPAKIYMGNSGSHFLGFVLAAIALIISYAPMGRKIALLTPVLILGLPIVDTAFLILVRILKKSLPFKKSNDHLALRFLALGYSKKKALMVMVGLALFYSLLGVLLSRASFVFAASIIIVSVLTAAMLTVKMGKARVS